jgi:hypothetical protein
MRARRCICISLHVDILLSISRCPCLSVCISLLICCLFFLRTCLYGIHVSFLHDIHSRSSRVQTRARVPAAAFCTRNLYQSTCPSVGALAPPGWWPWRPFLPFASRVLASIKGKITSRIITWRTLARASAHPECLPSIQNTHHTCLYALPSRAAHAHSFRRVWRPPFRVAKASNAARIPLPNAFPHNSFNSSNFSKIPSATDSPRLGHVERAHKH